MAWKPVASDVPSLNGKVRVKDRDTSSLSITNWEEKDVEQIVQGTFPARRKFYRNTGILTIDDTTYPEGGTFRIHKSVINKFRLGKNGGVVVDDKLVKSTEVKYSGGPWIEFSIEHFSSATVEFFTGTYTETFTSVVDGDSKTMTLADLTSAPDGWTLQCVGNSDTADPDLKGLWHMNEGTGTNIADTSGNGYDGVLSGTGGWLGTGKYGDAPAMNASDTGVSVAMNSNLRPGSGDFTWGAWIKVSSIAGAWPIVQHGVTGAGDEVRIILESDNIIRVRLGGVLRVASNSVASWIADGNWHQVVVTRSGSDVTLYYDKATKTGSDSTTLDASEVVWFGRRIDAVFANGGIDEYFFYQRALTAGQVNTLFDSGTGVDSDYGAAGGDTTGPITAKINTQASTYTLLAAGATLADTASGSAIGILESELNTGSSIINQINNIVVTTDGSATFDLVVTGPFKDDETVWTDADESTKALTYTALVDSTSPSVDLTYSGLTGMTHVLYDKDGDGFSALSEGGTVAPYYTLTDSELSILTEDLTTGDTLHIVGMGAKASPYRRFVFMDATTRTQLTGVSATGDETFNNKDYEYQVQNDYGSVGNTYTKTGYLNLSKTFLFSSTREIMPVFLVPTTTLTADPESTIRDLISNNWVAANTNNITPEIALIEEREKRVDVRQGDFCLLYRLSHNRIQDGIKAVDDVPVVTIDYRTGGAELTSRTPSVVKAHFDKCEGEITRIIEANYVNPAANYHILKLIRRTNLSDKLKKIYRGTYDVELTEQYREIP